MDSDMALNMTQGQMAAELSGYSIFPLYPMGKLPTIILDSFEFKLEVPCSIPARV